MGVPARQQETYPPAHMHAGEVWVSERLGDCGDYSCHFSGSSAWLSVPEDKFEPRHVLRAECTVGWILGHKVYRHGH